jgi:hypothetical protein
MHGLHRSASVTADPHLRRPPNRAGLGSYPSMVASFAVGVEERRNAERLGKLEELIWAHHAELKTADEVQRQSIADIKSKADASFAELRGQMEDLTSICRNLDMKVASAEDGPAGLAADMRRMEADLGLRHGALALQITACTQDRDQDRANIEKMSEDINLARRMTEEVTGRRPQFSAAEAAALRNILDREAEILQILDHFDDSRTCADDGPDVNDSAGEARPQEHASGKTGDPGYQSAQQDDIAMETSDSRIVPETSRPSAEVSNDHELNPRSQYRAQQRAQSPLTGVTHAQLPANVSASNRLVPGTCPTSGRPLEQRVDLKKHRTPRLKKRPSQEPTMEDVQSQSMTPDTVDRRKRKRNDVVSSTLRTEYPETIVRFYKHYRRVSQTYHRHKPESDAAHIWTFIDGIDDEVIKAHIQQRLLRKHPGQVTASKQCNGRTIHLNSLSWRQVQDAVEIAVPWPKGYLDRTTGDIGP